MIVSIIVFIVVLTVLVLIHELGHYTVARLIGVHVEEFGLGLPPRIFGKKIGDTVYTLNWLPIGGFVRLAGEDDDTEVLPANAKDKVKKHYFWARSKKERAAILVAGVMMNFLLSVVITTGLLVSGVSVPSGSVHIEEIQPGTPAETAGLVKGDVIRTVTLPAGGRTVEVRTPRDLIDTVRDFKGQEVTLLVSGTGGDRTLVLTPRADPPEGQGPLGVTISDLETRKYPITIAPFEAVKVNASMALQMFSAIGSTIWGLVTLKNLSPDVAGPIGIAQVTGRAVEFGWRAVIEFASILSLNLAVLNILPIPALDGGRLLFVFIEKIMGRKVRPAFEKMTHQVGMIILLVLVLLVSLNDIMRLTRGG
jgi:regulator of sigma E protease